jgi:LPXTG-motif cell wall-anchored protein
VRSISYIIWFVGAVVWWIDAALHLNTGSRTHALLAIGISLLFLAAGVVFRRQALRK